MKIAIIQNMPGFNKSQNFTYIYAFLILFSLGIGLGFLRNNFNKQIKDDRNVEKSLNISDENKRILIKADSNNKPLNKFKMSSSERKDIITLQIDEITSASPSLDQIKYLINSWLLNKSQYLSGKSDLKLSKIVKKDLIKRLIQERESDIQKGILKNINAQIENIEMLTQNASRISVSVDLKYSEQIIKTSGELINEKTFTPFLKVKYILGFSNKSWKLVDYISGV